MKREKSSQSSCNLIENGMQFLMGRSKSEVPVPTSVCVPDIEKKHPMNISVVETIYN